MTAEAGHNQPPASEAFAMAINDLYAEAKNYLDGKPIENQGQADSLTAILDGMKELLRDAEKQRKEEKQPHLDAGKEVDSRWKAVQSPAKLTIDEATKPLTVWRAAQQKIKDDEAKALRERAEAEEKAAIEARKKAESLEQAEHAEALLKSADIAKKTANKIDRGATGLRTYWEAEVTDRRALLNHIATTNPEWLTEKLTEYAESHVRTNHVGLPGVTAHKKQKAS